MARGYVKDLNLGESANRESDSKILNNLAGGTIADDIALFSNNLRNYGTLSRDAYEVDTENKTFAY